MKEAAICLEIPAALMQTSTPGRSFLICVDETNPLFIVLIYAFPLYFIAVILLCYFLSFSGNAIIQQNLLSYEIINYSLWMGTHYTDGLIMVWGKKNSNLNSLLQ